MKPTIYLALTHDSELRGDGSGDIEEIQFTPLRRLIELYQRHDVRATFFPELMQQLAFRRYQTAYPELRPLADSWDEHVRRAFRAGHDIQLHIHSRWHNAIAFRQGSFPNPRQLFWLCQPITSSDAPASRHQSSNSEREM